MLTFHANIRFPCLEVSIYFYEQNVFVDALILKRPISTKGDAPILILACAYMPHSNVYE